MSPTLNPLSTLTWSRLHLVQFPSHSFPGADRQRRCRFCPPISGDTQSSGTVPAAWEEWGGWRLDLVGIAPVNSAVEWHRACCLRRVRWVAIRVSWSCSSELCSRVALCLLPEKVEVGISFDLFYFDVRSETCSWGAICLLPEKSEVGDGEDWYEWARKPDCVHARINWFQLYRPLFGIWLTDSLEFVCDA